MTNPELADKILKAVYDAREIIGSTDLANRIQVDHQELIKIVYAIKDYNDEFIRVFKGGAELMIGQTQRIDSKVALFLEAGGFVGIVKKNETDSMQERVRFSLEMEHLQLQINNLKGIPGEQKKVRRLSIIAIVVSVTVAVIELIRLYRELKS